jgi:hypothetical protein
MHLCSMKVEEFEPELFHILINPQLPPKILNHPCSSFPLTSATTFSTKLPIDFQRSLQILLSKNPERSETKLAP